MRNNKTGMLLVAAAALTIVLTLALLLPRPSAVAAEATPAAAPHCARFQIVAAGTNTSLRAYVLDTTTGQVWEQGDRGFADPKLPR